MKLEDCRKTISFLPQKLEKLPQTKCLYAYDGVPVRLVKCPLSKSFMRLFWFLIHLIIILWLFGNNKARVYLAHRVFRNGCCTDVT